MSIKPGTTYIPFAVTTCRPSFASIFFATRAILPSCMATSMGALMLFFGSITWPPFMTIAYCWAVATDTRKMKKVKTIMVREREFILLVFIQEIWHGIPAKTNRDGLDGKAPVVNGIPRVAGGVIGMLSANCRGTKP